MQTVLAQRNYVTRTWLLARSAELRDRVRRVAADLGDDQELPPIDSGKAATDVENHEVLMAIAAAAVDELHHIDFALARLNAGLFAMCERCGEEIRDERIEAEPYAVRCAVCAGEQ
jgi:RNA polymerase-binding transcription factor DksA